MLFYNAIISFTALDLQSLNGFISSVQLLLATPGSSVTLLLLCCCLGLSVLCFYLWNSHIKWQKQNLELQSYIESNIRLEQFAEIASHDFKSPLRTVISFTGLAKKRLVDSNDKKVNAYLDLVEKSAIQLDNLTEDLLDYAQINAMTLGKSKFKVREMIQEVIDIHEHDIREKKADIVLSDIPEYLYADRRKIQRVFQNLISNATKFSKLDSKLTILINCRQLGRDFIFSFADNGIGIDERYLPSIFETLNKLNTNERFAGSGLGLAMSKEIIEKHGGKIWVESRLDEGSTFSFSLPRHDLEIAYDAKKELLVY